MNRIRVDRVLMSEIHMDDIFDNETGLPAYRSLRDDVNALGTFLLYNGLKGKNIAILGDNSYEWVVSFLAIISGTGIAVPVNKEWELHVLKRYLNSTDCACMICSESCRNIAWNLYNDGVTPIQTFISMGSDMSGDWFVLMKDAISQGRECIESGFSDFLDAQPDAQANGDDVAAIQFCAANPDEPKQVALTRQNVASILASAINKVQVDEDEQDEDK